MVMTRMPEKRSCQNHNKSSRNGICQSTPRQIGGRLPPGSGGLRFGSLTGSLGGALTGSIGFSSRQKHGEDASQKHTIECPGSADRKHRSVQRLNVAQVEEVGSD